MPVIAAIQLAVSTKDPREAVRECISIVRQKTTNTDKVQIDLGLICSANGLVLRRLAECSPGAALGFRNGGSDRAKTAQEFLSSPAADFSTFNGKLTEHLLPVDVFALIERSWKVRRAQSAARISL